jgi:hypothetical protein
MSEAQNYKNHVRMDPIWHFFVMPILLINFAFAVFKLIHDWKTPDNHHIVFGWWIVMSIVFIIFSAKIRMYPLKAQDRIIRLEERLRLAALLSADDLARSHALTEEQLIGLRFASDGELPALVARTLKESLSQKQIKEAIVNWRPDNFRV